MNCVQRNDLLGPAVEKAVAGLARFLCAGLCNKLEPVRLARVAHGLLLTGCSVKSGFPWEGVAKYLVQHQRQDGGWTDVEETIWCLGYLGDFGQTYESELRKGTRWLHATQLPCGGWGKTERDLPRIPITALAATIVPDIVPARALEWLAGQWAKDMKSPTPLIYKGAFFLLAQAHERAPEAPELMAKTTEYLCREQEDDGGFGPWKGHPVGSDPWTTGVVLWGLAKVPEQVPSEVLERAVEWQRTKQLPNGLWPYHYLDDGTSMALIGLSSVLPLLGG